MNAAELLTAMKRTVEQLAAFNDIAKALTSTLELREVLTLVMNKVSELLKPSNWSLVLADEKGELYFEICVGAGSEKIKPLRLKSGEGIAGMVFQTGEPRLVEDVTRDPAFSPRFDEASDFKTRSLVAVPLRSRGRTLGVIELVNGENSRTFTQDDLLAVSAIADFAAIAIENARNFQRVQELTTIDEHTGLFNARHLRALLEQEVTRAARFKHPLSLIFLDLDGFKQVNDTRGHLVGSSLLKQVGELLVSAIRQVDFAFRYGGDEFAVLLIETEAEAARVIGERIRDRFREKRFPDGITITASLGVASFPDHADSGTGLLDAADRAMYRVKGSGRNDVAVAVQAPARAAG
ncbi:MAG: sensor domain-containing diguanylate cyclase [Myxococcales bacterium]|nr:sensor domain-containing diguanylate cyclase [Myxococcales bacterium]